GRQLPLVTERVLVLVDGSPASLRAVRRAARLAGAIHAGLIAAVVVTPSSERQPFDRQRDLKEVLDDAVDLGAEVVHVDAKDVAAGREEVGRGRGVTHVVLPFRPVAGLSRVLERPLPERILDVLPDVELHLVGATPRSR